MLDENGVTGEVAMDDGGLAGVQVAAEKRIQVSLGGPNHKLWRLTVDSPESRQDLRAPAFPGLSEAKAGLKLKGKALGTRSPSRRRSLRLVVAVAPSRSWSCGSSLSFSRTASDFPKTCTL